MVSKRVLPAALGVALLVALPSSAVARQSRTQTLAKTFLMAAYLGPIAKPFPTVDISGGVNIFKGRNALSLKVADPALTGAPTPFTITPSKLGQALNVVKALMGSPKGSEFKIGLYFIDVGSGKVTARRFNATAGKAALSKLARALPAKPAAAIKSLRSAAFP